jgi:hypothetical protein
VILHWDVEYLARLHELFCYYPVVRRRCRISTRVIVDQNDRRGSLRNRLAKNFSRMNERGIEQAAGDGDVAFQTVLRVEDCDVEFLDRKILEPLREDLVDIPRPTYRRTFLPLFRRHPPAKLERGVDTNRTSRSYPTHTGQSSYRLRRQEA